MAAPHGRPALRVCSWGRRTELEGNVGRPHTVSERADRNEVRAGFSVGSHVSQGNPTSCLDLDARALPTGLPRPSPHAFRRLVVDQEPGSAGGTRFSQLIHRLHFHVQRGDAVPARRRQCFAKVGPSARERLPVIVLDHDLMLQVQSVPVASPRDDSGNIQYAQAGCRFPGMENTAARSLDGIDVRPGSGGYPRGTLEQVQQRPLCLKDGPKLSPNDPDD